MTQPTRGDLTNRLEKLVERMVSLARVRDLTAADIRPNRADPFPD